eukprot:8906688-Pyramimonas_sp.AAC.1
MDETSLEELLADPDNLARRIIAARCDSSHSGPLWFFLSELQAENDFIAVLCLESLILDQETFAVSFEHTDDDIVERFKMVWLRATFASLYFVNYSCHDTFPQKLWAVFGTSAR